MDELSEVIEMEYKCPKCKSKLQLEEKELWNEYEFLYFSCACSKTSDIISLNGKDVIAPRWRTKNRGENWGFWDDNYDHMYIVPIKTPKEII